jgi:FkbH-like protein
MSRGAARVDAVAADATAADRAADRPSSPAAVSPALFALHNGSRYRTPVDLQVAPDAGARYLVIGGCLAEPFPEVAAAIDPAYRGDFVLLNNFGALPELAQAPAARYDFQIVHIPLRTILGSAYFRLPASAAAHEAFLLETQACLGRYLDNALQLNAQHKLLTFVLGFLVPQQNQLGRLQPRYELSNVMHFVERLNMFLASETGRRENAHFVDTDQISSAIGKQACQDDMVWSFTHGTTLSDGDHEHDQQRIDPPPPMQQHYRARWLEFFEATLHEVFAMYRTTLGREPVKLVVVDLDDTLWRGIAAEGSLGIPEGWPMGFMETLLILKRRGILLAIVSKNDEAFIRSRWDEIVQGQIALEDFAACRINFRSKVENLSEILAQLSLRPENTLMIDDNPVERAAIQAGLPGVRVLGAHLYYLKRVLLWSAETQSRAITAESQARTGMVQAQLLREAAREALSAEEFLRTLGLRATVARLDSSADLHMNRALELLNKTNQFNTSGARYTLEQCHQRLLAGYRLYVLMAEDRFTKYGLIGAAWTIQSCVEHLVMSCRALGLELEDAFLAYLAARIGGEKVLLGKLTHTAANLACREIFRRNGFEQVADNPVFWARPRAPALAIPAHITLAPALDAGHGR